MDRFPELMKIRKRFGGSNLIEYVDTHILNEREFLPLDEEAYEVFSTNFKRKDVRLIATGSHAAFLQWEEVLGLGENILTNIRHLLYGDENVISAPCSRISFKNFTRPGSINLSGMGDKNGKLGRYILRGRSKVTVDKAKKVGREEIDSFLRPFMKFQKHPGLFQSGDPKKLGTFIEYVTKMDKKGKTYDEQCGWLSSQLWPHMFTDLNVDPLTIRSMESLTLKRENLLEDKKMRELMEKYFEGAYGALSSTYFYYGSCPCGIEFPLEKREDGSDVYLEGRCIDKSCSHYGCEKYCVEVKDILDELDNGRLHESLLMAFYNMWGLTGVNVSGGYNQAEYLTHFRNTLSTVFKKVGREKESEILQRRETNLIDLCLFPMFNVDGTPKSGSQVFLEGGISRGYVEKLSTVKLSHFIDLSLQTIAVMFGGNASHDVTLRQLQDNDMGFMIR